MPLVNHDRSYEGANFGKGLRIKTLSFCNRPPLGEDFRLHEVHILFVLV